MSTPLPKGAGTVTSVDEPDFTNVAGQNQPDPTLLETVMNMPAAIKQAYTAEGVRVEFPDAPEISDMGDDAPGFIETFIPNFKAMMTADDTGKAEIFRNTFKDDPRWGGAYVDKFGLPMIVWNKMPYYVNKPGFSGTDLNSFLGEIVKYLPATKWVGGAKGIAQTAARGTTSYAATEAVSRAGESYITPQTVLSRNEGIGDIAEQVRDVTALGVGFDVGLPPAAKKVGQAGSAVIRAAAKHGGAAAEKIAESIFPKFDPKILQDSKYPLTQGQRTAELPQGPTPRQTEQLEIEDVARQSASSGVGGGTAIIRGFDDMQLNQIRSDALQLQEEFGAGTIGRDGIYGNIPSAAAEESQMLVSSRASQLREESGNLYEQVRLAPEPPVMTPDGIATVARRMLNQLPELGISPSQVVEGPLAREVTRLRRLEKIVQNPQFKDQALANVHGYQKSLGVAIRQATPGSPDQTALIRMKSVLDDSIYEGIERGFITGDQEVIDQLRSATELWRQYSGISGKLSAKNTNRRAANKVLETLSNNDYTPQQVTNLLFGHNKFAPNQAMPLVLAELRRSLPADEFIQLESLLKDGILTRAFSGKGGEITRTAIVKNYNDVFNNQRAIIDILFSPAEIAKLKQFRTNVLPTLWAEIKMNPSGSGYTILSALARQQMLSFPSPLIRAGASRFLAGLDEAKMTTEAMDAVRQTLNRFQAPLISGASQALIRPQLREEADAENVLEDLPLQERINLRKAIDNAQGIMEADQEPVVPPAAETPALSAVSSLPLFEDMPQSGFGGAPSGFDASMSPTILPSASDREIAMRMNAKRSGISSLV